MIGFRIYREKYIKTGQWNKETNVHDLTQFEIKYFKILQDFDITKMHICNEMIIESNKATAFNF